MLAITSGDIRVGVMGTTNIAVNLLGKPPFHASPSKRSTQGNALIVNPQPFS
jgi:hypothetical protein